MRAVKDSPATPLTSHIEPGKWRQNTIRIISSDGAMAFVECPAVVTGEGIGEGEIAQMIDMLAQPIGAEHEAAGPEGTLVQPLDRLRVFGSLRQDGEGEVVHI